MKKPSFITILLIVLMSMTGAKAFAHDIEVANSDGKPSIMFGLIIHNFPVPLCTKLSDIINK